MHNAKIKMTIMPNQMAVMMHPKNYTV